MTKAETVGDFRRAEPGRAALLIVIFEASRLSYCCCQPLIRYILFFTLAFKHPKMGAKSILLASSVGVDSAQGSDLAFIFGDLSQSEKLSEINPPLACTYCNFKRTRTIDRFKKMF